MSNEVTLYQSQSSMPTMQEMSQFMQMSSELAKTPYYQKLGTGGVLAIILTARELGLPFMQCLNGGLYPIDGKVSMSAQLMNSTILKSGHSTKVLELTDEKCTIRFKRKDRDYHEDHTYSIDDARTAGLTSKQNWVKYRKAMLFSRCLSAGARMYMPDAIAGCYVEGEIEQDNNTTSPSIPVEVTEVIEQQKNTFTEEEQQSFYEKMSSEWVYPIETIKDFAKDYAAIYKIEIDKATYEMSIEKDLLKRFKKWQALETLKNAETV